MKALIITIMVSCLAAAAAVAGEKPNLLELFQRGTDSIKAERWEEAEKSFQTVLDANPQNGDVLALIGIAQFHGDKHKEAVTNLSLALKHGTRYASRCLYYLGLANSALGRKDASVEAFRRLLLEYPDAAETRKLLPRKVAPPAPKPPKRVSATIMLNGGYDSNPSMISETDADDTGGDMYLLGYLSLSINAHPVPLIARGFVLSQKFMDKTEFDMIGAGGGVSGDFNLFSADKFQPAFNYLHYILDGEGFETILRPEARYLRTWSRNWGSDLVFRYDIKSHPDEEYKDLDGNRMSAKVRAWRNCDGPLLLNRFRIMGGWTDESLDADYLGYTAYAGGLELEFALPLQLTLVLDAGYEKREYKEVNPTYNETRSDDIIGFGVTALRPLWKTIFLRAAGTVANHKSNIERYDYTRSTVELGLLAAL